VLRSELEAGGGHAVIERGDVGPQLRFSSGRSRTMRSAARTEATIEGGSEAVNM